MPVLRLKGPYIMALTINPDGSATYAITLPAPLEVEHEGTYYRAGGATVAADPAQLNGDGWARHIAGMIAVRDQMIAGLVDAAAAADAALAVVLYAADAADVPEPTPFAELDDQARRGYRRRARRLAALGVALDAAAAEGPLPGEPAVIAPAPDATAGGAA